MLVGDSNYKKRLNFRKRLEATRELTASALANQEREVKRTLPVDGFDPRRMDHQLGHPISWRELVSRILKMNPCLRIEDSRSSGNTVAVLYPDEAATESAVPGYRYVVAFDKTVLPEWTQILPVYDWAWDTEKRDFMQVLKTTRFLRGWREVLIRLLTAKLVKKADVDFLFPMAGQRKSWHELLKTPPPEKKQQRGPLITLAR